MRLILRGAGDADGDVDADEDGHVLAAGALAEAGVAHDGGIAAEDLRWFDGRFAEDAAVRSGSQ